MAALEDILQRHPVWLGGAPQLAAPAVPTGFRALDRELPGGGWPRGALTEILGSQEGIGELQLVLPALGGADLGRQARGLARAAASALCAGAGRRRRRSGPARRGARARAGAMRCGPPSRCCAPAAAMRCSAGCAAPATTSCGASRSRPRRAAPSSRCSARAKPRRESSPACLRLALEPDGERAFGPHPQAPRRAGRRAAAPRR